MNAAFESVSPKQAQQYLSTSTGNRVLKESWVSVLVETIRKGEFVQNGEPIIFDDAGVLIDGHHRLNAVSRAGSAVMMLVVRGAPQNARGTIDQGISRSLADALSLAGYKSARNYAAALRVIRAWLLGDWIRSSAGATGLRFEEAMEYAQRFPRMQEIVASAAVTNKQTVVLGLVPATFSAWRCLCEFIDREMVDAFSASLITGANLNEDDPIFAARRMLISDRARGVTRSDTWFHMRILMKAFDLWQDGKKIKLLRPDDEMPNPRGLPKNLHFGAEEYKRKGI